MTVELEYGNVAEASARFIALYWYCTKAPATCAEFVLESEDEGSGEAAGKPGVYVFEGRFDALHGPSVLYIGEAGSQSGRLLRDRINEGTQGSAGHCYWQDGKQRGLYSDVWDLTIRWAEVRQEHVSLVEQMLIHAHCPPFNHQHVRRPLEDAYADAVILNHGAKGRLLPVLAGAHSVRECWPRA